jgi:hypothetical protein
MNSDIVIITQDISEAVQSLTRQQIARAYAILEKYPDPPPTAMPSYETTWIGDGCVFLAIRKERPDSNGLVDFLVSNGFELLREENGLLLYSSPGDDGKVWRTWEAAWAFLRR